MFERVKFWDQNGILLVSPTWLVRLQVSFEIAKKLAKGVGSALDNWSFSQGCAFASTKNVWFVGLLRFGTTSRPFSKADRDKRMHGSEYWEQVKTLEFFSTGCCFSHPQKMSIFFKIFKTAKFRIKLATHACQFLQAGCVNTSFASQSEIYPVFR